MGAGFNRPGAGGVSNWWRARQVERRSAGHTRWRRFSAVMVLGALGTGGLMFGMSQGALAASFAVSGTTFKINADKLDGKGLVLYGGEVKSAAGGKAVATMGVRTAAIDNFCTAFVVRKLPILGEVSVKLTSPGGVDGDNLLLDVGELNSGTLKLTGARMGVDASKLEGGPTDAGGVAGSTGVDASGVSATGLKGDTWALTAGTISARGVNLSARQGTGNTCG